MDRDPLSLHAVRETRRFTHETRAVGARADRDEQPVLRFPHGRDGALLAIRPHLSVHAVRRAAEREFAERDDVPLPEEVMRGACRDIREIDLPFVQPLQEFVRRNIDKPHFPGFIKNPVRHGLADRDPGDAGHHVIQALEMLDIKRGVYIDPGFEQLLHILPALRVAAPGEIGVRELIHHEELRVALQCRLNIKFVKVAAALNGPLRKNLKAVQQLTRFLAAMGFRESHHNVDPSLQLRLRLSEHRVGLANPGAGAEEDLQLPSAALILRLLYGGQKRVRIGSLFGIVSHGACLLSVSLLVGLAALSALAALLALPDLLRSPVKLHVERENIDALFPKETE